MITIYNHLVAEEMMLKKQIDFLKEKQKNWPEGNLEVSKNHGFVQYYKRPGSQNGVRSKRKYIKKNEIGIAESIAQRDYERKLLEELEKRLNAVTRAIRVYERTAPENLAYGFSSERQAMIRTHIPDDKAFVKNWEKELYSGKPFDDNSPEIFTARGERVRSKSEKIIADILERNKIPYKYECPLILSNGRTVYPDFKVLNAEQRKEYIWEHFGMMDSEEYAAKAVNKVNSYIKNGYFPGEKLILTMESSQTPLGTRTIESIINYYLKQ